MKLDVVNIQNLAVGYVCLWATAPILAFGDAYRFAAIGAVALWAMLEVRRPGGIILRATLPVIISLFYIAYTLLTEILLGPEGNVESHLQLWILLFLLIFYESRRGVVQSMAPIFWLIAITLPIWLYITYNAFDIYGTHTARYLTRSSDIARELTSKGVGGYSLVYGTVLVLPAFAALLLNLRRFLPLDSHYFLRIISKRPYIIFAIIFTNLVLGFAVVIRAGFSIATIIAVISIGVSLIFRRKSAWTMLIAPLALMGGYIVLSLTLVPMLTVLTPIVEGTPYAIKVRDIILSLESDQSQGSFADRWGRYTRSLDIFLANPVFGVISARDVGKHSTYLDALARYGVIVGAGLFYLLLYLPIRLLSTMRENFGLALSVLLVVILVPLSNNVFSSFGVMLFVMVPVACDLVERRRVRASRERLGVARPPRRSVRGNEGRQ